MVGSRLGVGLAALLSVVAGTAGDGLFSSDDFETERRRARVANQPHGRGREVD